MQRFTYPIILTPDEEGGGYVVTFRDLPEVITHGDNAGHAKKEAGGALAAGIEMRIADSMDIPNPSPRNKGEHLASLPEGLAMKATRYITRRERAILERLEAVDEPWAKETLLRVQQMDSIQSFADVWESKLPAGISKNSKDDFRSAIFHLGRKGYSGEQIRKFFLIAKYWYDSPKKGLSQRIPEAELELPADAIFSIAVIDGVIRLAEDPSAVFRNLEKGRPKGAKKNKEKAETKTQTLELAVNDYLTNGHGALARGKKGIINYITDKDHPERVKNFGGYTGTTLDRRVATALTAYRKEAKK